MRYTTLWIIIVVGLVSGTIKSVAQENYTMSSSTNTLLEPAPMALPHNDVSPITYLLPSSSNIMGKVVMSKFDTIPPDPYPDEPAVPTPVGDGMWIIVCCGGIYVLTKLLFYRRKEDKR